MQTISSHKLYDHTSVLEKHHRAVSTSRFLMLTVYPFLFVYLFSSQKNKGVRCHAWLYLPTSKRNYAGAFDRVTDGEKGLSEAPPVVIMAHGMGGQKVRLVKRFFEHPRERCFFQGQWQQEHQHKLP